MLTYKNKRITGEMIYTSIRVLTRHGIHVKSYFILGFPSETQEDVDAIEHIIRDLWEFSEHQPRTFRYSISSFDHIIRQSV